MNEPHFAGHFPSTVRLDMETGRVLWQESGGPQGLSVSRVEFRDHYRCMATGDRVEYEPREISHWFQSGGYILVPSRPSGAVLRGVYAEHTYPDPSKAPCRFTRLVKDRVVSQRFSMRFAPNEWGVNGAVKDDGCYAAHVTGDVLYLLAERRPADALLRATMAPEQAAQLMIHA